MLRKVFIAILLTLFMFCSGNGVTFAEVQEPVNILMATAKPAKMLNTLHWRTLKEMRWKKFLCTSNLTAR